MNLFRKLSMFFKIVDIVRVNPLIDIKGKKIDALGWYYTVDKSDFKKGWFGTRNKIVFFFERKFLNDGSFMERTRNLKVSTNWTKWA